ncbi:hypothetical protein ACP0HM_01095 [Escherichia coli]
MKTIFRGGGQLSRRRADDCRLNRKAGQTDRCVLKASDGKTAELVNIMQDNLGGDFKEFQSAYEAVGTDLFDQQGRRTA